MKFFGGACNEERSHVSYLDPLRLFSIRRKIFGFFQKMEALFYYLAVIGESACDKSPVFFGRQKPVARKNLRNTVCKLINLWGDIVVSPGSSLALNPELSLSLDVQLSLKEIHYLRISIRRLSRGLLCQG